MTSAKTVDRAGKCQAKNNACANDVAEGYDFCDECLWWFDGVNHQLTASDRQRLGRLYQDRPLTASAKIKASDF